MTVSWSFSILWGLGSSGVEKSSKKYSFQSKLPSMAVSDINTFTELINKSYKRNHQLNSSVGELKDWQT